MTRQVMLLLCMLAATPALAAKQMSDADQKLMSGYVPTMEKLHSYESAIAKVKAACSSDPMLREHSEDAAAHPDESLQKAIDRVGKSPIYTRYLKPAGLKPDDVILLPVAMIGAGAVVEMHADVSKLPGLSQQQVEFYRAHKAEIGKMKLSSDCGEDEESPEDPQ